MKNRVRWMLQAMTRSPLVRRALLASARRRLLPDSICRRLPVSATFQVRLPDSRTFWYKSTARDGIGRTLYWHGCESCYEPETTALFYELARAARVIVDAGANTGYFTLLACAASDSSRTVCFEPAPQARRLLMDNIDLNGWASRCEIRSEAVSDAPGAGFLRMPYYDIEASVDSIDARLPGERGCEVAVTTIDAACPPEVDLVKLDIEGSEDRALAGMPRLLADSAPTVILEALPDSRTHAIHAILDPLGYRCFHLLADGPRKVTRISPDPTLTHRNYLFAARPDVIDFVRRQT